MKGDINFEFEEGDKLRVQYPTLLEEEVKPPEVVKLKACLSQAEIEVDLLGGGENFPASHYLLSLSTFHLY